MPGVGLKNYEQFIYVLYRQHHWRHHGISPQFGGSPCSHHPNYFSWSVHETGNEVGFSRYAGAETGSTGSEEGHRQTPEETKRCANPYRFFLNTVFLPLPHSLPPNKEDSLSENVAECCFHFVDHVCSCYFQEMTLTQINPTPLPPTRSPWLICLSGGTTGCWYGEIICTLRG